MLYYRIFVRLTTLGLESEADYAYTGMDGECAYDEEKAVGPASGLMDIPEVQDGSQQIKSMPLVFVEGQPKRHGSVEKSMLCYVHSSIILYMHTQLRLE